MNTKIIFKFLSVVVFILVINNNIESKLKRRKWCHFNEVIRCTESLRVFTAQINGSGIPTNPREFDAYCYYGRTLFPACLRKWTERCGLEHHQQAIDQVYVSAQIDSVHNFCSDAKREKFLKYGPCLQTEIKLTKQYRDQCIMAFQAGFEFVHSQWMNESLITKITSLCCVYNRWQSCITGFLTRTCGEGSDQIIVDLIEAGSAHIVSQACRIEPFSGNSETCPQLLPPMDTKPKGAASDSFLSFMFSYWCPNVGYGIIADRN